MEQIGFVSMEDFFTIGFLYLEFVLLRIMTYYVAGGIKEIVYFKFHSFGPRFCSLSLVEH